VPIRRGPVSVDAEGTTPRSSDAEAEQPHPRSSRLRAAEGSLGVTPAIPPSDDLLENLQKSLDLVKKQRGQ